MSRSLRIALILLFSLSSTLFGWQFKVRYDQRMAQHRSIADSPLASTETTPDPSVPTVRPPNLRLGWWGGGLVLSLLGLGALVAHEVADFLGARAGRAYYDDTQQGPADPDYELAEDEWNKGNFLEAIRLMRDYLAQNPRRQAIALRIAEIYEKDLHNPLAAALEYEEVLQHNLPRERWGWAAIHLCNLYSGRLNQLDKAIALLRRIEAEYSETAAAGKARNRLDQLEGEGVIPPRLQEAPPQEPTPPGGSLPPGFTPRRS